MGTSMTTRKKWIASIAILLVLALISAIVWFATRSGRGDTQTTPTPIASTNTTASPTGYSSVPVATSSPSSSTQSSSTSTSSMSSAPTPSGESAETKPFNGYTIKLPAGTTLISTKKGEWGDVRTLYKTPEDVYIEVISFSADFKYREFTEEITNANPDAKSGNFYDKFTWGGSQKGHAEAWVDLKVKVDGRERSYFYLYTTTSDADNVAVIEYGTVSPSKWLLKAIEQAVWTEGE